MHIKALLQKRKMMDLNALDSKAWDIHDHAVKLLKSINEKSAVKSLNNENVLSFEAIKEKNKVQLLEFQIVE